MGETAMDNKISGIFLFFSLVVRGIIIILLLIPTLVIFASVLAILWLAVKIALVITALSIFIYSVLSKKREKNV